MSKATLKWLLLLSPVRAISGLSICAWPLRRSHSHTAPSSLRDAKSFPSVDTATEVTPNPFMALAISCLGATQEMNVHVRTEHRKRRWRIGLPELLEHPWYLHCNMTAESLYQAASTPSAHSKYGLIHQPPHRSFYCHPMKNNSTWHRSWLGHSWN